jgi:hypothetical protein
LIDLHCHSTFSDGTDHPEALALAAHAAGLRALALTDHDTLGGIEAFLEQQSRVSTLLVAGIELSCRFMGRPLHVLGLFLDHRHPGLVAQVSQLRIRRQERNQRMLELLQARSIPITWEALVQEAPTDLISRTHFARALVRCGAAGSLKDAFQRLIGDDSPCSVPFKDLGAREASTWIREAGGVAVVAHPGRSFPRNFRWDQAMLELKQAGMQGFEAYYPDYGPAEQRYFLDLAEALDMVPCGGSDYHGGHKPGLALGVGGGSLHVPDAVLERLRGLASTPPAGLNLS